MKQKKKPEWFFHSTIKRYNKKLQTTKIIIKNTSVSFCSTALRMRNLMLYISIESRYRIQNNSNFNSLFKQRCRELGIIEMFFQNRGNRHLRVHPTFKSKEKKNMQSTKIRLLLPTYQKNYYFVMHSLLCKFSKKWMLSTHNF